MGQEPENAFRTTTSCLPAYIQLCKWHLIAQHVAMVTFLSHVLKCTHTHTWSWREARLPHFMTHKHRARELSQAPKAKLLPWSQGWGAASSPHACQEGEGLTAGAPPGPGWLTWEQFCSGRLLQRYDPGLSGNWHSCSAPWHCGAGSSLLSCEEEQKQDTVSNQVTPPSPGPTFFWQSLPSPEKLTGDPSTSSPPVHWCQHSSCLNSQLVPCAKCPGQT